MATTKALGRDAWLNYFRDQSNGSVNLKFDVYGPVKVDLPVRQLMAFIEYGGSAIRKAIDKLAETGTYDFSAYDWDGDGAVEQVLFVAAGYSGHQVRGYIYPNTGTFFKQLTGGLKPNLASVSCEQWSDNSLCGIGTIIHEFLHCLGLPDIYPLGATTAFSVVDEWDVMDGGNYTNKGWCPPNLTAMERMYLGWESPVELTEPATIDGMKPLGQGGQTYVVRSDYNSDFYIMENRRQEGWDYACPVNGLLIYHVDFDKDSWGNCMVNTDDNHFRYDLFHADGKNYLVWDPNNNGKDYSKWTMSNWMRSSYLSTSPYPYIDAQSNVINDALTDDSTPVASLFASADGLNLMGKSITNIRLADDGTVSFDFMKSAATGTASTPCIPDSSAWFSLSGRKLSGKPTEKGVYVNNGKKVVIK